MVTSSRRSSSNETKHVPLRMNTTDYTAIERAAETSGISVNAVLNGIIHTWVIQNATPLGSSSTGTSLRAESSSTYASRDVYAASVVNAAAYGLQASLTPGHPEYQDVIDRLAGNPSKEGS